MAISAEDIRTASFATTAPGAEGYDFDEVDVFLDHVADEVEGMNALIADLQAQVESAAAAAPAAEAVAPAAAVAAAAPAPAPAVSEEAAAKISAQAGEIEALKAQVADLEAQLAEKAANDAAISQALIVAQRSADEVVANARNEASSIIKEAHDEADRIVNKAESDRQRVIEAIRTLEGDRNAVRSEYRGMLADFMADAQRKLAGIDEDMRQAAAVAQARNEANAVSYAPLEALTAAGSHAGARTAQQRPVAIPVGADPMVGGVPAETMAAPVVKPSASGYIDKDFSGFGAADDDIDVDVD